MAGVAPRCTPKQLADALGALEVRVDSASVEQRTLSLSDYPGEPRPSSELRLVGNGCTGRGENVAFTAADHELFAAHAAEWLRGNQGKTLRVEGALVHDSSSAAAALATPSERYERAALEAALIDLALRQAGLTLYDLTGVQSAELRFVVSLAADPDPLRVIRAVREASFSGDLKVDVDPSWNDITLMALARDSSIAIFDFKGRGDSALAERLWSSSPRAIFEDPPSGLRHARGAGVAARLARDAPLTDEHAVAAACARGEAVNLKAPRMGGPLEVLRGLERARESETLAYLGGMFEVGVGRHQARQLAALYSNRAPNDLALNVVLSADRGRERADSPVLIRFDGAGFGREKP